MDATAIASNAREALVGDARENLRELLELLETAPGTERPGWGAAAVLQGQNDWRIYNDTLKTEPGTVDPRDVVDAIAMTIGADDVLVCDASLVSGWGAAYLPIRKPGRRFMAPRGLAGIGWGGPAAIGAQTALGSSGRTVALIGDGAWGYSLAEAETAVRRNLPITFVILNNSALAWVLHDRRDTGKALSCDFLDTDYAAAAVAFGATGVRLGPDDDLETALASARRDGGVSLLDIRSSRILSPVLSPPHPQ